MSWTRVSNTPRPPNCHPSHVGGLSLYLAPTHAASHQRHGFPTNSITLRWNFARGPWSSEVKESVSLRQTCLSLWKSLSLCSREDRDMKDRMAAEGDMQRIITQKPCVTRHLEGKLSTFAFCPSLRDVLSREPELSGLINTVTKLYRPWCCLHIQSNCSARLTTGSVDAQTPLQDERLTSSG